MTVDPDSISDRTNYPEGRDSEDPLNRYETMGAFLLEGNKEETVGLQSEAESPKETLEKIRRAKEGSDQ